MSDRSRREGGLWSIRKALALVAGLLAVALVTPLWSTRMEAPQYRNEEALSVKVYAGRVSGDIEEIQTLNQYVGVHLPLDTPELKASPWGIGVLLITAVMTLAVPSAHRRKGAAVLFAALLLGAAAGGSLLQYRLYQMGHVRDHSILEGVPDFTPPLLGTSKIANFTVTMRLGLGGWAYLASLILTGWALFAEKLRGTESTSAAPQRSVSSEGD